MVGKVEAYAALGAALKNERWAWSGHGEDEATVVVTLWADKMREVPGAASATTSSTRPTSTPGAPSAATASASATSSSRATGPTGCSRS